MSSNPKEPFAGTQCYKRAIGGTRTVPKGLGIMSPRIAGKPKDVPPREKRPFPCDSKACLIKNSRLCNRATEKGQRGVSKRPT